MDKYFDLSNYGKMNAAIYIYASKKKEAEKISINFQETLKIALQQNQINTALQNGFFEICLHKSANNKATYEQINGLHKIEIFDEFNSVQRFVLEDEEYEACSSLDSLIYEVANYSNKYNNIFDDILVPLIEDKDLYSLLCEFAERNSDQIADDILLDLAKTFLPSVKAEQIHLRMEESFVESWIDLNDLIAGEDITHPEFYRQQFVTGFATRSTKSRFRQDARYDIDDITKLIKEFISIFSALEKSHAPFLVKKDVVDDFTTKVVTFIDHCNDEADGTEIRGDVSQIIENI